jgi:hypothetical protein
MKRADQRFSNPVVVFGLAAFLSGCNTISYVVSDDTDYIVREKAKIEKLHVVNIAIQQHMIPAGPRQHILLVADVPSPKNEWKLRSLVSNTVEWRRLDLLFEVATGMIYDDPMRGDESAVRWILGVNPLIVAVGDAKEKLDAPFGPTLHEGGKVRVGATYHLVTSKDLAREVKRIYILDQWPKEGRVTGWEQYGTTRRVIDLPKPLTLFEVLAAILMPPLSASPHSPSAANSAH